MAMNYEKQLAAMKTIMDVLQPLDGSARADIWNWVGNQLGLSGSSTPPSGTEKPVRDSRAREGTVNVVCQKIGVASARDLLLAAAAHLTLYQGKDSFSKEELVSCAKEARSWKGAYSNQIAINIKRMCDAGVLFEKSKDVFSLSDASLADVERKLSA
jgi:hypothetical protein